MDFGHGPLAKLGYLDLLEEFADAPTMPKRFFAQSPQSKMRMKSAVFLLLSPWRDSLLDFALQP